MTALRLGTRGSALALWQANTVADRIRTDSGHRCELVTISTTGDRLTDVSPSTIGGKNIFVKEIEQALRRGDIDLAVHSAKDMPAVLPEGLAIPAVLPRADARDAAVMPTGRTLRPDALAGGLGELANGAPRVGTGSVRRVAQLRRAWPAARFHPIRGNVGTRLAKLDDGLYDLLILAAAGLRRLGHAARIAAPLDVDTCVPAPGQGIIAIETRAGDHETIAAVAAVNDPAAETALTAERALVETLGGGCQVPIGAFAEIDGRQLSLRAVVAALDGSTLLRRQATSAIAGARALGVSTAEGLLEDGAGPLLDDARGSAAAAPDA